MFDFVNVFQPGGAVNVGSTERNSLAPTSEVWLCISMVLERSVCSPFNHLTRLLVREYFTEIVAVTASLVRNPVCEW